MKTHMRWLLLLTTPIFGFTDCSYFSEVTVPAVDTSPPYVGSRVWSDELSLSGDIFFGEVAYQTSDPYRNWMLAPWGYDPGGLKELRIDIDTDEKCCKIHPTYGTLCQKPLGHYEQRTHSETGEVGDTVSNGHYGFFSFELTDYGDPSCDLIRLGYLVTATDFAGNVSSTAGSVTYINPVPDEPLTEVPPRWGNGTRFPTGTVHVTSPECTKSGSCSERPPECQFGFAVQGTWACDDNRDVCVFPAQGVANSYCSGPWTGASPNLCGRGLASQHQYGSACTISGLNSRCMPGTACKPDLDPQHGAGCGEVPACGTLADCWLVDDNANICQPGDDWL